MAERSGLSARTIRGLESGRIRSPHTATLLELAAALDLPREYAETFLRAWDGLWRIRSYAEVMAADEQSGLHRAMREGLMRSFLDKRIVAATRLIKVGSNKLIKYEFYQTVIEALSDGVDSHLVVGRSSTPHQDVRLIEFADLIGCAVRSRGFDPESKMHAVELGLGQTLREGEMTTIAWREINGWAATEAADADPELQDTKYANAFLRPVSFLALQVGFEGVRPRRVWRLQGRAMPERVAELVLDDYGCASAVWQNVEPGGFGIEWEW